MKTERRTELSQESHRQEKYGTFEKEFLPLLTKEVRLEIRLLSVCRGLILETEVVSTQDFVETLPDTSGDIRTKTFIFLKNL